MLRHVYTYRSCVPLVKVFEIGNYYNHTDCIIPGTDIEKMIIR